MKTWDEVKKVTLSKLFMDESEADQQGYLGNFVYFANEALNIIANSVKPKYIAFEILLFDKNVIPDNLKNSDSLIRYNDSEYGINYVVPDENTVYKVSNDEKYIYSNNKLILDNDADFDTVIEGTNFTFGYITDNLITMPDNFISFADMVEYLDGEAGEYNIYFGRDKIKLKKPGNYIVYYNALYDEIPEETANQSGENFTPVYIDADQSIINLLPSYIASQILAQDDIVRSTQLKNEYELALSRLDNDVMYETKHFKSTGGWY